MRKAKLVNQKLLNLSNFFLLSWTLRFDESKSPLLWFSSKSSKTKQKFFLFVFPIRVFRLKSSHRRRRRRCHRCCRRRCCYRRRRCCRVCCQIKDSKSIRAIKFNQQQSDYSSTLWTFLHLLTVWSNSNSSNNSDTDSSSSSNSTFVSIQVKKRKKIRGKVF